MSEWACDRIEELRLRELSAARDKDVDALEQQQQELAAMYDLKQQDLEHACAERDELYVMLGELQHLLKLPPGLDTNAMQLCINNVRACTRANDDLHVQVRFWKCACEQALDEGNKLEDTIAALREVIAAMQHNVQSAHELMGEEGPPEASAPHLELVPE